MKKCTKCSALTDADDGLCCACADEEMDKVLHPERYALKALQAERDALQAEVKQLDEAFSVTSNQADALQAEVERLKAELEQAKHECGLLTTERNQARAKASEYKGRAEVAESQTECVNCHEGVSLTARDAALEEAAKVCEELFSHHYDHSQVKFGAQRCAVAIRALKKGGA